MGKRILYLFFILLTCGVPVHASFIEGIKNVRALVPFFKIEEEKNYFSRLSQDSFNEILSYLTVQEKKEARTVCKKFQKMIDNGPHMGIYPLAYLSDFLAFDYYNKQKKSFLLTGDFTWVKPKIVCEIYMPPTAFRTDIILQIVLMKKGDYGETCSVEKHKQRLEKQFSLSDELSVYIFNCYKKVGEHVSSVYNNFKWEHVILIYLFNALYNKQCQNEVAAGVLLNNCALNDNEFQKWIRSKFNSKEYGGLLKIKDNHYEIWKKFYRYPFHGKDLHDKYYSYVNYYLPLFINNQIPTIVIKEEKCLSIEVQNTLLLDTPEYKEKYEKFCSFNNFNKPWFSKKVKERTKTVLFVVVGATGLITLGIGVLEFLLFLYNMHFTKSEKKSTSKKAVIDYMQGYIKYVAQKRIVS